MSEENRNVEHASSFRRGTYNDEQAKYNISDEELGQLYYYLLY